MKIEKLSQHLKFRVEDYAEKIGALKLTSDNSDGTDKYSVELEKIILEFVYYKKAHENCPVSTLYCRIHLDKESGFFFEIPEIIAFVDILDYHCYYFPYIENVKRMDACFDYITDFIEYREREILSLCDSAQELKEQKIQEIKRVYDYDESRIPEDEEGKNAFYNKLDEYVSVYTLKRFVTGKAHLAYLDGDYDTALKEYEKQGELLTCEKRIVEFIDGKLEPYQAMPLECASLLEVVKYKKKSIKTLILSVLTNCIRCPHLS